MFYCDYQLLYPEIGYPDQWPIQEFQTGGGGFNPWEEDRNLLFGKVFTENCMKMKENGSSEVPPLIR